MKQLADLHNLKSNMFCRLKYLLPEVPPQNLSPNLKLNQSMMGQAADDLLSRMNNNHTSEDTPTILPYVIDRIEVTFRD